MDYLKKKYTKEYFLHRDKKGRPTDFGVEGIADFLSGEIRANDKAILDKINFSGQSVLDLGFGRGEALKYAKEHGAKKLVGVDFSETAVEIAKRFLKIYHVPATLIYVDLIKYLRENKGKQKFDLIILLGVIEHIPRIDVRKILPLLRETLTPKGVLIVNTPVFAADNDGYQDGIDERTHEDSDEYEETQGMHINRYTKESLLQFMKESGFTPLSTHYFVAGSVPASELVCFLTSYPFRFPQLLTPETYEYAYSRRFGQEPNVTLAKKVFRFFKWKAKAVLIRLKVIESDEVRILPRTTPVLGGPLSGQRLFLAPKKGLFWQDMILGVYDQFIYDWLAKHLQLSGKVVWDIGAHVGYHSLSFAAFVGEKGKVVAIEPNQFNLKRLKKNLRHNPDLAKRIKILPAALSDKNGLADFVFSDEVEDTRSSGSHLGNTPAPEKQEVYAGFKKTKVWTHRADSLVARKILKPPRAIKIDVEGAETLVLLGAEKTIRKYKPVIFIEIHSVSQMFSIQKFFVKLKYALELLDDANGSTSRCFVVAVPPKLVQ